MTDHPPLAPPPDASEVLRALRAQRGLLIALGILTILGGAAAVAWPILASVAVTTVVGAALMIQGFVQLWDALLASGWRPRLWHVVTALIALLGGAMLLFKPFAGILALTTLLIATILAGGLARLFMALQARPQKGWGWLLLSGLISLACGGYLASLYLAAPADFAQENLAESATKVAGLFALLGLAAGISLIFEGWSYLLLALALPKRVEAVDEDWAEPDYAPLQPSAVQPPAAPGAPAAPLAAAPPPPARPPTPAAPLAAAEAADFAAPPEAEPEEPPPPRRRPQPAEAAKAAQASGADLPIKPVAPPPNRLARPPGGGLASPRAAAEPPPQS